MTPELADALARWETGALSRDELARRFPDEDISGILDAFDRMSAVAAEPTPDASAAWKAVAARLPDRLADRRRGRGTAIRLLAAAMIAVLLMGATAYAFVPGVRRAVNNAAGEITGGSDQSPGSIRPDNNTGPDTDKLSPDASGGDASQTQGDDNEAADPNSNDASGNDADTDANSGSNDDGAEGDSVSGGGSSGDDSGSDAESAGDSSGSGSGDEGSGDVIAENDGSNSGSEGSES